MYKVKYLQEELTSLFRTRILEDGNPAEDAMDYLGNIDFHALTQAVQDKARTAYTYITQGMQEKSFNYPERVRSLRGPAHHRPYPCAVPRLCRQDHPGRL